MQSYLSIARAKYFREVLDQVIEIEAKSQEGRPWVDGPYYRCGGCYLMATKASPSGQVANAEACFGEGFARRAAQSGTPRWMGDQGRKNDSEWRCQPS